MYGSNGCYCGIALCTLVGSSRCKLTEMVIVTALPTCSAMFAAAASVSKAQCRVDAGGGITGSINVGMRI